MQAHLHTPSDDSAMRPAWPRDPVQAFLTTASGKVEEYLAALQACETLADAVAWAELHPINPYLMPWEREPHPYLAQHRTHYHVSPERVPDRREPLHFRPASGVAVAARSEARRPWWARLWRWA